MSIQPMNIARGFAWLAVLLFVGGLLPIGYQVEVVACDRRQTLVEQSVALGSSALLETAAMCTGIRCWHYVAGKVAAIGSSFLMGVGMGGYLVQFVSQLPE